MSHFSNIGFVLDSREELEDLLDRLIPGATAVTASRGRYLRHSDPSGAEVYIQLAPDDGFLGCNPHFHGESARRLQIQQRIGSEYSALDGAFYGWTAQDLGNDVEHPLVFNAPDFLLHEAKDTPFNAIVQLTGFAEHISCYADEAAFSEDDEIKGFARRAFVPVGEFNLDGEERGEADTTAVLTGDVVSARRLVNRYSQDPFLAMVVATLNGPIDVVCDADAFEHLPEPGHIVAGRFWLSGKIIDVS